MLEHRKDYILDRWVIIATDRGQRPEQYGKEKSSKETKICPFDPGNESMTPPEIDRIEKDGEWKVRCFPNLYPAALQEQDAKLTTDGFFTYGYSFGKHEVIANTPDHKNNLEDLSDEDLALSFEMFKRRINKLNDIDDVEYVAVFHNQGKEAGGSLVHTHSQVIAMSRIPNGIQNKIDASNLDDGSCAYCKIINIEKSSDRFCFENDTFVAFTPFASRNPFELWIFPKEHKKDFNGFSQEQFVDLAELLKKVLIKLAELSAPYNLCFFISPVGKNLHFHVEVDPRLTFRGGFEYETDTIINTMAPEEAAKFYRGE